MNKWLVLSEGDNGQVGLIASFSTKKEALMAMEFAGMIKVKCNNNLWKDSANHYFWIAEKGLLNKKDYKGE